MTVINYVRSVIKLANYAYKYFPAQEQIICLVVNSCSDNLLALTKPDLCSENMIHRFTEVIARTILFYRVKWDNDALKKKRTVKRKSSAQQKVDKLSHK